MRSTVGAATRPAAMASRLMCPCRWARAPARSIGLLAGRWRVARAVEVEPAVGIGREQEGETDGGYTGVGDEHLEIDALVQWIGVRHCRREDGHRDERDG